MRYVILTEKPSAMKNFVKALGGKTGTFDGNDFQVVALRGHVMALPNKASALVDAQHKDAFDSWHVDLIPWDTSLIKWQKAPIKAKNPRTGKIESTQGILNNLKSAAQGADAIVIATDTDPSGEGELLGWEAINAIGWRGKVLRENHADESEAGIKKALRQLRDVTNQRKDGDYVKAEGRNYWDYLSMQLTRVATTSARDAGYDIVARQGRLKSVMVYHIFEQLEAIKHYHKKPYYEVQFKDGHDHTFSRKFDEATDDWRFDTETKAKQDMANYANPAHVTNVRREDKTQAPGKLLDLSGLTSLLTPKGYSSKEIQATYQKMYEDQVVSYPRTEDKVVTQEQFNELLPLVDQIANVVGVDPSLLTHRTPRKKHVGNGAHGANRPGLKVPNNLQDLDRYGASAQAIYETLAKNYLSILGEDYEYERVSAELAEDNRFKTAFSIPKNLAYKAIFDSDSATDKDDEESDESMQDLTDTATPVIKTGANKKPTAPTVKWLMTYLEKQDVGTGATRVSTLADISSGKSALLKETKGKLTLTDSGKVSGALAKGTMIASPKATRQLFDMMDKVGRFELSQDQLVASATQLIKHDKPVIMANAADLQNSIGEPSAKIAVKAPKPKATGTWQGKTVSFAKEWSGHPFTDAEIADLLAGKVIEIEAISKAGKPYKVHGALAEGSFKGHTFVGFKPDFNYVDKNDPYLFKGQSWKHEFSGHTFTSDELDKLVAGEVIEIKATSKAGKQYTVSGQLEEVEWKGKKSVRFVPDFGKK